MTQPVQAPKLLTITVRGARFRSLFNICDSCGAHMTRRDLKAVANAMGDRAREDNLVFACSPCFSQAKADGTNFINYLDELIADTCAAHRR